MSNERRPYRVVWDNHRLLVMALDRDNARYQTRAPDYAQIDEIEVTKKDLQLILLGIKRI